MKKFFHAGIFALGFLVSSGCSPHVATTYTFDKQLLAEADGKFREKNYVEALKKYDEIVKSFPNAVSARSALYKIAYINVYYDNSHADWVKSLRAFRQFQQSYPDDPRISEVNTWIRILVSMESFSSQYGETSTRVEFLKNTAIEKGEDIALLREEFHKCAIEKDSLNAEENSLIQKIKELEATILKIEKPQ